HLGAAPGPAGGDDDARAGGARLPPDPLQHAGRAPVQLRPGGPRQGAPGAHGHPQARAPERHAADDHRPGPRRRVPYRRLHRGRDGLRLSRLRPANHLRDPATRSPPHPGVHAPPGGHVLPGDGGRRPPLRVFRSAHPLRPRTGGVTVATPAAVTAPSARRGRPRAPASGFLHALRRLPASLVAGAVIVLLVVAVAAGADWLAPYPYDEMHYGSIQTPPGREFMLGTDQYGRD